MIRLQLERKEHEDLRMERETYVKSPLASLCLTCSSVRKRVRVTMSVLTFSC